MRNTNDMESASFYDNNDPLPGHRITNPPEIITNTHRSSTFATFHRLSGLALIGFPHGL